MPLFWSHWSGVEHPAAEEPPVLDLAGAAGGEGEEEEEEEEEEEGAGAGAGEEECVAFFMSPFLAEGAEALEVESIASRASAPLDLLAAAAAAESPWAAAVFFFLVFWFLVFWFFFFFLSF